MSAVEVLLNARRLFIRRERWTRSMFARNDRGQKVSPHNPAACQWCAVGGVLFVAGIENPIAAKLALKAMDKAALRFTGVVTKTFNDRFGYDDVLALFDEAITEEEVPR